MPTDYNNDNLRCYISSDYNVTANISNNYSYNFSEEFLYGFLNSLKNNPKLLKEFKKVLRTNLLEIEWN